MAEIVQVTQDNVEKFRKLILELGRTEILVGVPSDEEQPHRGVGTIGTNARINGEEVNNAELAAIHDLGAPEANIPARPFMLPGMEKVSESIEATMKTAAIGLLSNDRPLFEMGIGQAGNIAVDGIRTTIEAGIPPPLKPATLAARRRRGIQGNIPLIATKQLIQSISFVVRKGEG